MLHENIDISNLEFRKRINTSPSVSTAIVPPGISPSHSNIVNVQAGVHCTQLELSPSRLHKKSVNLQWVLTEWDILTYS